MVQANNQVPAPTFVCSITTQDRLKVEGPLEDKGKVQRQVSGQNYTRVEPTPIIDPYIAVVSDPVMQMIGLGAHGSANQPELAKRLSGNILWPGSDPVAHCYCGYQFGYFSGQLGDGRAISLGDVRQVGGSEFGAQGSTLLDLQLKGAGLTPYSRTADGRAVLRSSIREFLASEAMFYLGVPTTRAASLVVSDQSKVKRDKLYDGNAKDEKCAVVMRVAPSFMRFGSFEIFLPKDHQKSREGPSFGLKDAMLEPMVQYLVENFYPEIAECLSADQACMRTRVMYEELVKKTAEMVAAWQCVGFCHGVLNTDNMSMLGLTIDYGPFGFMDFFDTKHICNHSDTEGRYRYEAQPEMCKWNLGKLAEALDPLLPQQQSKDFLNKNYYKFYFEAYRSKLAKKLGLHDEGVTDEATLLTGDAQSGLVTDFWAMLDKTGSDFTNTFRCLSGVTKSAEITEQDEAVLAKLVSYCAPKEFFISKAKNPYEGNARLMAIMKSRPEILRFYGHDPDKIQRVLDETEQERARIEAGYDSIKAEYRADWTQWLRKYKYVLVTQAQSDEVRATKMNKANPRFILRNWLLEQAIVKAETKNDYSDVEKLLELAKKPFDEPEPVDEKYFLAKPSWAFNLCVSCSS